MFNRSILTKYAVILRLKYEMYLGWSGGAASENHDAPNFKQSSPRSIRFTIQFITIITSMIRFNSMSRCITIISNLFLCIFIKLYKKATF